LLGLPIYQPGHTTLRPVHFHVNQNATLKAPRYALGLETGIRHTTLAALPGELAALNSSFSTTPIHVLIERPACVNMVIIDTPGLGGDDAIAKKAETLVASMSSPGRRYLCVEAAAPQWQPSLLRAVVSALDPRGTRTTFVYTMAHIQLRNFVTYDQAARYFRLCPAPRAIFVDSLSRGTRDAVNDVDTMRQRIVQAQQRLGDMCRRFSIDAQEYRVGLKTLLDEMHRCGVQDLEHQMPAILDAHRAQLGALRGQLATIMLEQDSLEPHLLRAAATRWAGSFGQSLSSVFSGAAAGAGQTLEEERAASGIAWSTAPGSPVPVPAADIEESRTRLLGVQQLHRLTHDFRAACAKIALTAAQVSADDVSVVVAAGPPSAYQRALAAAEIASRHALKLYGPLVAQLFERAVAIVDRLPDVAFDAAVRGGGLDGRRLIEPHLVPRPAYEYADGAAAAAAAAKANAGGDEHEPTIDVQDFPFLLFRVRDALATTVRQFALDARGKCVDELRCFFIEKVPESEKLSVPELAHLLFDRMRVRAIENVVLKFQCFFANRCAGELTAAVYAAIAVMPDAEIEQVFRTQDYAERLNGRSAVLRVQMRRVAESQDMLESRLVQSSDPSIRKSFIVPRKDSRDKDAPKEVPKEVTKSTKAAAPTPAAVAEEKPKAAAEEKANPLVSPRAPTSKAPTVPTSKAPAAPSKAPPAKRVESDEEDSDDLGVTPVAVTRKPAPKVEEDEDDEDEDSLDEEALAALEDE
jgi:hypothetical protein